MHPENNSTDGTKRGWGCDRQMVRAKAVADWARDIPTGSKQLDGGGAVDGKFGLYGPSMGGINIMHQIKAHGDEIAGAVVFQGVADLTNGLPGVFDSGSFLEPTTASDVAQAYRQSSASPVTINSAGGGCEHTGLAANTVPVTATPWTDGILPEHNPVQIAGALSDKPPVLWFANSADATCWFGPAQDLADEYGSQMTLIVTDASGHLGHLPNNLVSYYRSVIRDFVNNTFDW
jgi:hypothetical protein